MLPKQALAWVLDLEKRIGNLSVSCGLVDIWPIIRNSVTLALLDESSKPWPARRQKLGKSIRFFRSLLSIFRAQSTDILFVTDPKYSECIGGLYYIKDVDGVVAMEENRGKSLKLVFSDEPDRPLSHDVQDAVSLYALRVIASILTKVLSFFPIPKRVSRLSDAVCSAYSASGSPTISVAILRKRLRNNVVFAAVAGFLLRFLLKRIQPEKVFIHCYYSPFGMALCAACKSCDIDIVDVQHGLAGPNMRAYGQWKNCPKGGFSTLPSRFLCWTETDAQAVNEWSENAGLGKIAIFTGSLWFKTFHESGLYNKAREEWQPFVKEVSKFERVVVLTLQSPELDSLNVDRSLFNSPNVCFLIRAHPNSIGYKLPDSLLELELLFSNVFVSNPTAMPIHYLMEISDINVTAWSASVYDATLSNCKSIVVSTAGRDYFERAVKKGDVEVLSTKELSRFVYD